MSDIVKLLDENVKLWQENTKLWGYIEKIQRDQAKLEVRLAKLFWHKFSIDYYNEINRINKYDNDANK